MPFMILCFYFEQQWFYSLFFICSLRIPKILVWSDSTLYLTSLRSIPFLMYILQSSPLGTSPPTRLGRWKQSSTHICVSFHSKFNHTSHLDHGDPGLTLLTRRFQARFRSHLINFLSDTIAIMARLTLSVIPRMLRDDSFLPHDLAPKCYRQQKSSTPFKSFCWCHAEGAWREKISVPHFRYCFLYHMPSRVKAFPPDPVLAKLLH